MGKTILYRLRERVPGGGIPVPTLIADFEVFPGTNTVEVRDTSTSNATVTSWLYQLLNTSGVVVDSSTEQNHTFTSVAAAAYSVRLTVTSSLSIVDAKTSEPFTVDAAALATPTGLAVGTVSSLTVPLTFSAPVDATYVTDRVLLYGTTAGLTKGVSASVSININATTYDFTAPSSATWYFALYDVGAIGFATDSALSSEVSAVVGSPGLPPGDFSLNPPTVISAHRIDLSWTAPANGGQFAIYRGTTSPVLQNDTNLLRGEVPAGVLTHTDQTVSPSTTYYYSIRAFNGAGQNASNELSGTTPAQGAWPENEAEMILEVGGDMTGVTTVIPVYQGQADKKWGGGFFNYSGQYDGFGPDGVTPRLSVMTDPAAKYNSTCLIKRRWADQGDQVGYGGVFINRTKFDGANGPYSVLYFRVVFETDTDWKNHTGGTKLFYWGGKSSKPQKSATYAFFLDGNATFHLDCDNADTGTIIFIANGSWWTRGVRNTVEMAVKCESAVGACDGKIRVRANGNDVGSWVYNGNDTVQRAAHVNNGPLDAVKFTEAPGIVRQFDGIQCWEYKGGSSPMVQTFDDYIKIDELYVSGKH